MKYNFNERIERKNNHSAKWEEMDKKFISNDLWPMWIADMDLKTAPEIINVLGSSLYPNLLSHQLDALL